jgi:hypothetical protein
MHDVVLGYGKNKKHLSPSIQAYFDQDLGPYMPSDALFYMVEIGNLFQRE